MAAENHRQPKTQNNENQRTTKLLIIDDKNQRVHDQGACKIQINKITKIILILPFSDEGFKTISVQIDESHFIQENNILCVFNNNNTHKEKAIKIALIFSDENICKKVYSAIFGKNVAEENKNLLSSIFVEKFLSPIFGTFLVDNDFEKTSFLKSLLLDLMHFYKDKNKEENFTELMKEKEIYHFVFPDLKQNFDYLQKIPIQSVRVHKRKLNEVKFDDGETNEWSGDEKNFDNSDHDSDWELENFNDESDFTFSDEDISDFDSSSALEDFVIKSPPMKKQKLFISPSSNTVFEGSNFNVISFYFHGQFRSRLFIFSSSPQNNDDNNKRLFCYEYFWSGGHKHYVCCSCLKKRKYVTAFVTETVDGKEFVEIGKSQHACPEMVEYNPKKYLSHPTALIIKKSDTKKFKIHCFNDFNGIIKKRLFIFMNEEDKNQNYGYDYFWDEKMQRFKCCGCATIKKHTSALINQDKDDANDYYIQMKSSSHLCTFREYHPEIYEASALNENILAPNFKIINQSIINLKSKILIFPFFSSTKNEKFYYEYIFSKKLNIYKCHECRRFGRNLTAKLCKNSGGIDFIKLNDSEHICALQKYNSEESEKTQKEIILRKPDDYELTEKISKNGIKTQQLIIFKEIDKNFNYKYNFNENHKRYYCIRCTNKGIFITAKINLDENGNEFCSIKSSQKHICKPYSKEEENIPLKTIKVSECHFLKRRFKGQIYEKMIIFDENDRNLCYEYSWDPRSQMYYCWECQKKKKVSVYAKIIKTGKKINGNGEEDYIELSKNEHKCGLRKFVPENLEIKILKEPQFKIEKFKRYSDKPESERLVIFDSIDKSKCYVFNYNAEKNKFQCAGCMKKGKYYRVKLMTKNESIIDGGENNCCESYVELPNNKIHICKSIKYQPTDSIRKIITLPNFKLTTEMKKRGDGGTKKLLLINDENNKKLSYKYFYLERLDSYVCNGCQNKKKYIYAKLKNGGNEENNGENYVELGPREHVCKPESHIH